MRHTTLTPVMAALALAIGACTDAMAPGMGRVQLSMARDDTAGQPSTSDSASEVRSSDGSVAGVPVSAVASLEVTVTSIQFLRAGDEDDEAGGWITLQLSAPVSLNLMALPTEGDSPVVIASGSVEAGTYTQVRLFVTDPSVEFSSDVTIGAAATFQAGVEYAVTIPSAGQTGIKTDASFTVTADESGATADVGLLFDAGTTFANVAATGNGQVILAPVLRSRD